MKVFSSIPRTAYILQIHKNVDQVNKFINQIISNDNADVFIHIDKKHYNEIRTKILRNPNVHILEESFDVKWGDISMVDATLLLLKSVVKSGNIYDYICLRSGQDLLVKNGLKEFFINNKNRIFMTAYRVNRKQPHAAFVNVAWPTVLRGLFNNPFHPYRILRRLILSLYGLGWNWFPNKDVLPDSLTLYNGSQWFCIPQQVGRYILEFLDQNNWFYDSFKDSLCPDEFFFQTLIMNSKYKSDVTNSNLMYIKFGQSLSSRNNPITLKMEFLDNIKFSNEFFARKFDETVDTAVIDHFSANVTM